MALCLIDHAKEGYDFHFEDIDIYQDIKEAKKRIEEYLKENYETFLNELLVEHKSFVDIPFHDFLMKVDNENIFLPFEAVRDSEVYDLIRYRFSPYSEIVMRFRGILVETYVSTCSKKEKKEMQKDPTYWKGPFYCGSYFSDGALNGCDCGFEDFDEIEDHLLGFAKTDEELRKQAEKVLSEDYCFYISEK